MWNLNGEDIQRAKEELKGRRAAIQARYETELKQLEVDIADLETFERFAEKFVADFKNEAADAADAAQPSAADVVAEIVANVTADVSEAAAPAAMVNAPSDPVTVAAAGEPVPEPALGQKTTSRWRMRLNTGEASA